MLKKVKVLTALCLMLVLVLSAGCGGSEDAAAPTTDQPKEDFVFGVVQMTQDIPVQIAMNEGMEAMAEEIGHVKIVALNGNLDVNTQINGVENFIQQKVDAIILNPADADSIVNAVKAANAAGIPVFTFDTDANGGEVVSFIEANNGMAGQYVAEYMAERLQGKGKVAILDLPSVSCVRVRTQNWYDVMKAYPDIEVVQTEIAATVPDGLKQAETILQAHPDLDAFFAINDPGGLGAYQAIKARGLEDQIFIAAIDGDPEAVNLIATGNTYGCTVAQFGAEIGKAACKTAYDYLTGVEVSDHIMVPVMAVTKDNYQDYPGWAGVPPEDLTPPWKK